MRSTCIVPVATVGFLLCLSHDVSANVFSKMQPRNAPPPGVSSGVANNNKNNANTRVNRNRNNPRNSYRNVPTHVLHRGPEKVRAMRRHYKFPIVKRAQDDESKAHAKGVGANWKDVVQSDSSAKEETKPAAPSVTNGAQAEKKERPGRPERIPNKPSNNEATTNTEQTNVFSEPKSEVEQQVAVQQEQHAAETMNVMDIASTFVPPSTEVFTHASRTPQQQRRKTPMIVAGTIALTGMVGLAFVIARRTLFPRKEPQNIMASNVPIRMIDEDGDPIDLETHYGIASIGGSRSSAETRASMGFHL